VEEADLVEIGTWSKPAARLIRFVIRLAFLRRLGDVRPLARIRTQIRDAEVVRLAAQVQLLHDLCVAHLIREYHDALADQPLLASDTQLRQPDTTQELGGVDVLYSQTQPPLSHVAVDEVAQDGLKIGHRLKSKSPACSCMVAKIGCSETSVPVRHGARPQR
jgi:hypothetical protein